MPTVTGERIMRKPDADSRVATDRSSRAARPRAVPDPIGAGPGQKASPSGEGSITALIEALKGGDRGAAHRLWEIYYGRLIVLARVRLGGSLRRVADEEDVVVNVFDSLFRRAAAGRFPHLEDRDDLWKLLFAMTIRKAIDQVRREGREIPRGGRVPLEPLSDHEAEELIDREPTPALAAEMADQCRHLLEILTDPVLRRIAVWKLEGYTNDEIARRLEVDVTTVERKLGRIRRQWAGESSDEGHITRS
jgi:RNA polymerase sigma factor (sigma-70 family)